MFPSGVWRDQGTLCCLVSPGSKVHQGGPFCRLRKQKWCANIPHINWNVKAHLDVIRCWLQSFYEIMHGHCAPEYAQHTEMTDAFDIFGIKSSYAANVESLACREGFSLSKGLLALRAWSSRAEVGLTPCGQTSAPDCARPLLICDPLISNREREGFSAGGVIPKNCRNSIGFQSIESIMPIYHNFPDDVLPTLSALSFADIASDQQWRRRSRRSRGGGFGRQWSRMKTRGCTTVRDMPFRCFEYVFEFFS